LRKKTKQTNKMSEAPLDPIESTVSAPCTVCGNEFENLPNHLFVISNSNKSSMLFIQLTKNETTPEGPQNLPVPMCMACLKKVVAAAGVPQKEEPETN